MSNEEIICPRCESDDIQSPKSWILEGGKGGHRFKVHAYKCNRCKKYFRKLERLS